MPDAHLLAPVLLALLAPVEAATALPTASPTYDATGDWVLHVAGPRLVAGDCEVMEDAGYDEAVHIEQDQGSFLISTDGGQAERGTVNGTVYTHFATQQGTDVTGVDFILHARSIFTLTSPDASVGETVLELRFADGTECLLDLRFEGERLPQQSGDRGAEFAPFRPA